MSPSLEHERVKKTLARLLEAYAEEHALELNGYGAWTVRDEGVERGAEPDECYVFGAEPEPERPDLALEVIWTRGGFDKLELYRKLRIRELWLWENGRIRVFELVGERYEERERSVHLPELDLDLLARHTAYVSQTQAVLAFRKALRSK